MNKDSEKRQMIDSVRHKEEMNEAFQIKLTKAKRNSGLSEAMGLRIDEMNIEHFTVPNIFLGALINSDLTGLSDEDEFALNTWIEDNLSTHETFHVLSDVEDMGFMTYHDLQPYGVLATDSSSIAVDVGNSIREGLIGSIVGGTLGAAVGTLAPIPGGAMIGRAIGANVLGGDDDSEEDKEDKEEEIEDVIDRKPGLKDKVTNMISKMTPQQLKTATATDTDESIEVDEALPELTGKQKSNSKIKRDLSPDEKGRLKGRRISKESKIMEHRIHSQTYNELDESDAIRIMKERIRYAKTGKGLEAREAFGDTKLGTPKNTVGHLMKKYGSPKTWEIAEAPEGSSFYVVSGAIPETSAVKVLEKQITSLDEEVASIRNRYKDVGDEYRLPQEIKLEGMKTKLGELQNGYRHHVAKWLTLDEARAVIQLAHKWEPKEKK